ncbi:hypothetical protein MTE01_05280 [Microbacterium testaceum]|uniref:Uncharacterized protein n=1 Tax=Microbacterium testaceum TaxID=2033 RepID=A0A4Y3QIT4_MICTE|nr:hypothetical protein MTE01_05280 [Microbacterium testaceum]
MSGSTGSRKLERPADEDVPDAETAAAVEPDAAEVPGVDAVAGPAAEEAAGAPGVEVEVVVEAASATEAPPKARLETASAPTTIPAEMPRTERRRRGNISLLMSGVSFRRRG